MNSRRPNVPSLVVALVASGLATASAQVANPLRGHVKSVDLGANRLVVTQAGTGEDLPVTVGPQAQVMTTTNQVLTLGDLTDGDGVVVTHVGGVATRIVVNPAPLRGIVKSVDPGARRLVMRQAETDKDVTVNLGDRATILTEADKPLVVGDLKEGDLVLLTRDGDVARKVVVLAKPDELTGHVKSIAADFSTFVVTETGTNKDVTVAVDGDTTIATTEGKTLNIKDLKEGDGVGLTHVGSVAKRIVVNVKQPQR